LIDLDGDMSMFELASALADVTGIQEHLDVIGGFLCPYPLKTEPSFA